MNKVDLNIYPDVTYKEVRSILVSMSFIDESTNRQFIYTFRPLNAKVILPLPKQHEGEQINKAHLWGNVLILQEKGVISSISAFYKIVEHQKYFEENVLV